MLLHGVFDSPCHGIFVAFRSHLVVMTLRPQQLIALGGGDLFD